MNQLAYIQSVSVVNATGGITDRDYLCSRLMQQLGRNGTCIAKALHSNCSAFQWPFQMLARALDGIEHAAACGLVASQRSAQADRLAGHHTLNRVALGHAVG